MMTRAALIRQFILMVAIWFIAGAMLGIFGSCLAGCSCRPDLPTLIKAQSYVDDAESAIEQAERFFASSELSEDIKSKAATAISKARAGLRAASSAIAGATDLCELDIIAAFANFNLAWAEIRSLMGTPVAGTTETGGSEIQDPIVYTLQARG